MGCGARTHNNLTKLILELHTLYYNNNRRRHRNHHHHFNVFPCWSIYFEHFSASKCTISEITYTYFRCNFRFQLLHIRCRKVCIIPYIILHPIHSNGNTYSVWLYMRNAKHLSLLSNKKFVCIIADWCFVNTKHTENKADSVKWCIIYCKGGMNTVYTYRCYAIAKKCRKCGRYGEREQINDSSEYATPGCSEQELNKQRYFLAYKRGDCTVLSAFS